MVGLDVIPAAPAQEADPGRLRRWTPGNLITTSPATPADFPVKPAPAAHYRQPVNEGKLTATTTWSLDPYPFHGALIYCTGKL